MYSCTRNFNIKTTYGLQRIIFISTVVAIILFLVSFEIFNSFVTVKFSDDHFLLFVLMLILLYPVHKLLHLIAFIDYFKSLMIQKVTRKQWPPLLNIRVDHPISKWRFAFALVLPFIIITAASIVCAVYFPHFGHYFMFLFSVNAGISFIDFVYLKYILNTPKDTYVEERRYGFEILTKCDL